MNPQIFSPQCQQPAESLKALKNILLVLAAYCVLFLLEMAFKFYLSISDIKISNYYSIIGQLSSLMAIFTFYWSWRLCRLPRFFTLSINICIGIYCIVSLMLGILYTNILNDKSFFHFIPQFGYLLLVVGNKELMFTALILLSYRARSIISTVLFSLAAFLYPVNTIMNNCFTSHWGNINTSSTVLAIYILQLVGVLVLYGTIRRLYLTSSQETPEYMLSASLEPKTISQLKNVRRGFQWLLTLGIIGGIMSVGIFCLSQILPRFCTNASLETYVMIHTIPTLLCLGMELTAAIMTLTALCFICCGPSNIIPKKLVIGIILFLILVGIGSVIPQTRFLASTFGVGIFSVYMWSVLIGCSISILKFLKSNRWQSFFVWFLVLIPLAIFFLGILGILLTDWETNGSLISDILTFCFPIPFLLVMNMYHLIALVQHELGIFLKVNETSISER